MFKNIKQQLKTVSRVISADSVPNPKLLKTGTDSDPQIENQEYLIWI